MLPPGLHFLYYTIEYKKYKMSTGRDLTEFFALKIAAGRDKDLADCVILLSKTRNLICLTT